MPELETREDGWARGVFDRVRTGQDEPPWVPDAAAAAGESARRRRARTRVAGAATTAAVLGISAAAYATLGGGSGRDDRGVTTPAPTTASSAPPLTPSTSSPDPLTTPDADLGKYLDVSGSWNGNGNGNQSTETMWSETGMTTVNRVMQALGGFTHIRPRYGGLRLNVGPAPAGSNTGIQASGYWTVNGDISPVLHPDAHPSQPIGYVTITVLGPVPPPSAPDTRKGPCGVPEAAFGRSLDSAPAAWSPCGRAKQSDGSVVMTTHALNNPEGIVTVGVREFPNGSMVLVTTSSYAVYFSPAKGAPAVPSNDWTAEGTGSVAGPSVQNGPWGETTLALLLTWSDIKGLP